MRYLRNRRFVFGFALIYVGAMSMLLTRVMYASDPLTMLFNEIGSALIIGGIVWIISDYFFMRIEGLLSEQKVFKARGIRELRIISPKEIEELVDFISTSTKLSIQLDFRNINHGILELMNNLKYFQSKQIIRLLLAGTETYNLSDIANSVDASFEQKMFADLVQKVPIVEGTESVFEVKQYHSSISNVAIIGDRFLLLLMPYSPKSGDLFWITVETYSQLAEQYRKQFSEYWENAVEISG